MERETPSIVIADDDTKMLAVLNTRLTAEGYEVHTVQDSYQALQIACRISPDLMLLDVNMPAGDGFSVQDRLQRMDELAAVPVIYITGDKSRQVALNAEAHGAFAILHKPFETADLLRLVREALDHRNTGEPSFRRNADAA